jgi:hypothetical protein
MKLLVAIKEWFGYGDEQRAKDAAYDARPSAFEIRERLLPDIKTYNLREGTITQCLCGYFSWVGQKHFNEGYKMPHHCFAARKGGVHREADQPMSNNAMLMVRRHKQLNIRNEYRNKGWEE